MNLFWCWLLEIPIYMLQLKHCSLGKFFLENDRDIITIEIFSEHEQN